MENPITQLEQLTLNGRSKSFLKETAKWSFFLSIVGFISLGFLVLLAIFAGAIFNDIPEAKQVPFDLGMVMTIIYLIMAILYFFPIFYLFKFSKKMKLALLTKNDETLSDAFEMLKSHYKFIGVFTIILLSLYALIFIISMMGVALA
ncbi:DUF5362 domain-containing protein [Polaribacter sp. MSW13]|uniref:DUF5362 domain-containing protein n=1 Tax=Polaribacter marinus TaxID=2916838 RepID=A0A9X1VRR9_9FLAO|nr:DUF5362 family protein [Polaribacter marinus]MCI2228331.1 DUF5362 domain-containing protein [Polaribacter marinus]